MASSSTISSRPPPAKPLDLDLTVVSAKHLKNVNWKTGDLKPYAVFWVDPDHRLATKSDDSGSNLPVWNERFTIPLLLPLHDSYLTLEIFHSKPSETPKPLVGTLRVGLKELPELDDASRIRTFELVRPSGRPQGKIRVKLGVRERPLPPPLLPPADYHIAAGRSYFYASTPMPPRDYGYGSYTVPPTPQSLSPPPPPHYTLYHDAYSASPYYSGYYGAPAVAPPMQPRPMGYGGPSAPVDYTPYDQREKGGKMGLGGATAPVDYTPYDQRQTGGKMGLGTGPAVGAVAGALGGTALEKGMRYEEEKIAERVENDIAARDDYSEYHRPEY